MQTALQWRSTFYDSSKLFAVWGVDLSTITPTVPHTTAIVQGAYSNDGGNSWHVSGLLVLRSLTR